MSDISLLKSLQSVPRIGRVGVFHAPHGPRARNGSKYRDEFGRSEQHDRVLVAERGWRDSTLENNIKAAFHAAYLGSVEPHPRITGSTLTMVGVDFEQQQIMTCQFGDSIGDIIFYDTASERIVVITTSSHTTEHGRLTRNLGNEIYQAPDIVTLPIDKILAQHGLNCLTTEISGIIYSDGFNAISELLARPELRAELINHKRNSPYLTCAELYADYCLNAGASARGSDNSTAIVFPIKLSGYTRLFSNGGQQIFTVLDGNGSTRLKAIKDALRITSDPSSASPFVLDEARATLTEANGRIPEIVLCEEAAAQALEAFFRDRRFEIYTSADYQRPLNLQPNRMHTSSSSPPTTLTAAATPVSSESAKSKPVTSIYSIPEESGIRARMLTHHLAPLSQLAADPSFLERTPGPRVRLQEYYRPHKDSAAYASALTTRGEEDVTEQVKVRARVIYAGLQPGRNYDRDVVTIVESERTIRDFIYGTILPSFNYRYFGPNVSFAGDEEGPHAILTDLILGRAAGEGGKPYALARAELTNTSLIAVAQFFDKSPAEIKAYFANLAQERPAVYDSVPTLLPRRSSSSPPQSANTQLTPSVQTSSRPRPPARRPLDMDSPI